MVLAIGLGAFGAHGLKGVLSEYALEIYHKANFYHITQSLGLFFLTILYSFSNASARLRFSLLSLTVGILIFSGSLYVLAITGEKWLGAITPIGGIAMIVAWGNVCFLPSSHTFHSSVTIKERPDLE